MLTAASGGPGSVPGKTPGSTNPKGDKGAKDNSKGDKAPKDEVRMPVQISCQGPFRYDLDASNAHFSQNVTMTRQTGESQFDRLFSDELAVMFEKSAAQGSLTADTNSESKPSNLQFQFRQARATGRSVRVVSDAQGIEAIGSEMEYDAGTGHTMLRGDPDVVATKEGSVLHGHEIKFTAAEPGRQSAEVIGEGSLETRDADGQVQLTAQWTESARFAPQGEQDKLQLLLLQGTAKVEQPGRGTFQADRLKVWLQPNASEAGTAPAAVGIDTSKWSPSRVEGVGHVEAQSDQFMLHASNRLDMVFEDPPPATNPAAMRITNEPGAELQQRPSKSGANGRGKRAGTQDGNASTPGGSRDAPPAKPPARLTADFVKIKAYRVGDRTEVADVETEGHVEFEQPPGDGNGDAVLVRGDALTLKRIEEKYALLVIGRPAHVELNTMKVDGDRVNLDQPTGTAWVDGKGRMIFVSDTSLEGKKLAAPSELTITWGTRMFFDGIEAEFGGGVEARQGTSRLRCQSLVAELTERMDISAPPKWVEAAPRRLRNCYAPTP